MKKETLQALRDYAASIRDTTSKGFTTRELAENLGITDKKARALLTFAIKDGIVKLCASKRITRLGGSTQPVPTFEVQK